MEATVKNNYNRWSYAEVTKESTAFEQVLLKYWERLEENKKAYIVLKNKNKL